MIIIERCNLSSNVFGLTIEAGIGTNNITVRDCSIDQSIDMGIVQFSREGNANNIFLDNINISNSGLNGIYTTFSQGNWIINNCKISNSTLNGMILEGFQNLLINNSQVLNSGAHGIIASIRMSQNIEIENTQIFNAGNECLRIDNIENLIVDHCELTNYLTTYSSPIMKIQDIYNGAIRNSQFNSVAGVSDGLFIRNSQGITVDNCGFNILCNQPQTNCPVGINVHGGVTSSVIRNCNISGNPSVGINIVPDVLNGFNEGVVVENCLIQGSINDGIFISTSTNCAVFDSKIFNGKNNGLVLDAFTGQCAIQNNKLINNLGIGLSNAGFNNQIYHNFANGNGTNYTGVALVVAPAPGIGVLENING